MSTLPARIRFMWPMTTFTFQIPSWCVFHTCLSNKWMQIHFTWQIENVLEIKREKFVLECPALCHTYYFILTATWNDRWHYLSFGRWKSWTFRDCLIYLRSILNQPIQAGGPNRKTAVQEVKSPAWARQQARQQGGRSDPHWFSSETHALSDA